MNLFNRFNLNNWLGLNNMNNIIIRKIQRVLAISVWSKFAPYVSDKTFLKVKLATIHYGMNSVLKVLRG